MLCPMCQASYDAEQLSPEEGVHVFCCPRCSTGVLRVFARHAPDDDGRAPAGTV